MRDEHEKPKAAVNRGVSKDKSDNIPKEKRLENVVKNKKNNKRKNTLIALAVAVAVIVAGSFLCYTKLFKLKKLEIIGDCPYTEQELLDGMGLEIGETLYGKSNKEIMENVKYNLAYIEKVEITRSWPSTMKVKVYTENPTFYISMNDSMYILSQNLRVLSKTDDIENVEIENLVCIDMTGVRSCVEGEYLVGDDKTLETLKTLYSLLVKYEIFEKITDIDITNRFDIKMMYGTKFSVKLGDELNLETKIKFMLAIIDELGSDITGGIIDVSDENAKEGTFENFT